MEQYVEKDFRSVVNMWLPWHELDHTAQDQIRNVASHPEVVEPVAIMPDCHGGYGVPIGCVFATEGSVVPNAVGVDIGCGMGVADTRIITDTEKLDGVFWRNWARLVRGRIPVGFKAFDEARDHTVLDINLCAKNLQSLMVDKAAHQLGTLGGGNHFLEAQLDTDGRLYFMVHSGSRHLGLRIAQHYQTLAVEQSKARGNKIRSDLASLRLDSQEGQDYLHDMQWACKFAAVNRTLMLREMVEAFAEHTGIVAWSLFDTPHNYAVADPTNAKRIIHRKGATSAALDEWGAVPGSMGSLSYLVRGLGNPLSLSSCSHGAGRKMGRGAAKRAFTEEQFTDALANTFSTASAGILDESPMAYKDIETVMSRQHDLVHVTAALYPLITVKADDKSRDD